MKIFIVRLFPLWDVASVKTQKGSYDFDYTHNGYIGS